MYLVDNVFGGRDNLFGTATSLAEQCIQRNYVFDGKGEVQADRIRGCLYSYLLLYRHRANQSRQNQCRDAASATARTEPESAVCTLCTQWPVSWPAAIMSEVCK